MSHSFYSCNIRVRVFTGIVKGIGVIKDIQPKSDGWFFSIAHPLLSDVSLGASVAIDGVCLTVILKEKDVCRFQVMPETLKKTTLANKKQGDSVNIEPTLRVGDEMGGHIVSGHVDGVGDVAQIKKDGDGVSMTIRPPKELLKYIVMKGSIAVDGVSLTIARVDDDMFTVFLIEYTLANTTLGNRKEGDRVNIEMDMLAKYVEKILNAK